MCHFHFLNFIEFVTSDTAVAISFSSVPTAGDQLNVTCTATVPERLVYTPSTVVISYDSGGQQIVTEDNTDATQSEVSQDGNIFSRVVTIDPVKITDARRYFCLVSFSQPLDTSPVVMSSDLFVNSKQLIINHNADNYIISIGCDQYPLLCKKIFVTV